MITPVTNGSFIGSHIADGQPRRFYFTRSDADAPWTVYRAFTAGETDAEPYERREAVEIAGTAYEAIVSLETSRGDLISAHVAQGYDLNDLLTSLGIEV